MDGTFELNKPGLYEAQTVMLNDFLNGKLTTQEYGIYYSVKFQGDAETYLWQTKSEPEEGKKYWGHIEESKSGKSMRFKLDKQETQYVPDDETKTVEFKSDPLKQDAIHRSVALEQAVNYHVGAGEGTPKTICRTADTFYSWLKGDKVDLRDWDSLGKDDAA